MLALITLLVAACYIVVCLYRENTALRCARSSRALSGTDDMAVQLLESSPYYWIVWDPEAAQLYLSPEAQQALKMDAAQISFSNFLLSFPEKTAAYLAHSLERLSADGAFFEGTVALRDAEHVFSLSGVARSPRVIGAPLVLWLRPHILKEDGAAGMSYIGLRNMLDGLPFPVWHRDATGQLNYCNRAYAEALDQTPAEVLKYQETLWTDVLFPVSPSVDHAVAARREHIVLQGSRRFIEFREVPFPYTQGRMGYTLDLSDAELVQKQLERHVSAQQELLERLSCGVTIYSSDQQLQFFNHAYARMYQLDENWLNTGPYLSEILEQLNRKGMLPEESDFPAFKRRTTSLFTSLMAPIQELSHLPDERTMRMVTSPYPMGGLFFLFEDVTDSLVLERQTNMQMAVLKVSAAQLHEGVAIFSNNHTLKLSNPAFSKLWGRGEHFVREGMHISELCESLRPLFVDAQAWETYKDTIIESLTERVQKSGRLRYKEGMILEYLYAPLPDGSHFLRYLDISQEQRIQDALREGNAALESSERLKSIFLDHISYELKAPLHTIIGFSEILAAQYLGPLNEAQGAYCRGILQASRQQLALVDEMVDLATIEAGHLSLGLQAISVGQMLDTVVAAVDAQALRQDVRLIAQAVVGLEDIAGDERRLKKALTRLLLHIVTQSPPGGQVSIEAQSSSDLWEIGIVYCTDPVIPLLGGDVSGLGIEGKNGPNLGPNPGFEMSVSLLKRLVELHGGQAHLETKEGKGRLSCQMPLRLAPLVKQESFHFL